MGTEVEIMGADKATMGAGRSMGAARAPIGRIEYIGNLDAGWRAKVAKGDRRVVWGRIYVWKDRIVSNLRLERKP